MKKIKHPLAFKPHCVESECCGQLATLAKASKSNTGYLPTYIAIMQ